MRTSLTTRPTAIRLAVVGAVLALLGLAAACGSTGTASPASSASTSATPPAAVTPSPSATTSSPSVSTPSSSVPTTTESGAPIWQPTADESSAALTATERFVQAIDAQDFTAAGDLLAPDAGFQLEDITNEVAHMALAKSAAHVFPDEQGTPHLAMNGSGYVNVVAKAGAGLGSGLHKFTVEVRRDSRRDEWRLWSFKLQR